MASEYNSTCVSTKHQEFNCLTKYGVSSRKFTAANWCDPCKQKYDKEIQDGRIVYGESKPGRKRKTAKKS